MRIERIHVLDIPPIKNFSVDNLGDVVVLAGPNGVGKSRLLQGIVEFFQNPLQSLFTHRGIELTLTATCESEESEWGKNKLDASNANDMQHLLATLTQVHRRAALRSSILSFESDRNLPGGIPVANAPFVVEDPFDEDQGWNATFAPIRGRLQDTMQAL